MKEEKKEKANEREGKKREETIVFGKHTYTLSATTSTTAT